MNPPFSEQMLAFPIPHLATLRNKEYRIFLNGENRRVFSGIRSLRRVFVESAAQEIRRSLERAHSANGDVTNRYAGRHPFTFTDPSTNEAQQFPKDNK
ncbi:hypothetical protein TNIN_224731 [Trichonephila inaurata madagascariensis]|uniref:Uncharacterized protein n=1 Tax=Trichonephila inaurata madagascariensis TaxID=2747483 RepID=A0A8X6YDR4_9ARAC|nr:hypothetical protein TNIN_224731 [Trichonephila inaurata madagascariensis]